MRKSYSKNDLSFSSKSEISQIVISVSNVLGRSGSKKLTLITLFLVCQSLFLNSFSQYSNVPVTGFNADVVLNGPGTALTSVTGSTATVDNVPSGYWLTASDWTYNASGCTAQSFFMPNSGTVAANSTVASGLTYSLQPYSGLNDLRIPATGTGATGTGTLNVTTPVAAANLYLLYTVGNGPTSGINVTVTFTDATTQVISSLTGLDWYNNTNPAITNLGRIQSTVTGCTNTVSGGPSLYDLSVPISSSNWGKFIQSIKIDKTVSTGVLNIFAVGMKAVCSTAPSAPTTFSTALAGSGTIAAPTISGAFTAAAGSPTGYLVVRYPAGSTPTAPVLGTTYITGQSVGTGTVVQQSASTTITASGLRAGTLYDFYVYSYSSPATCGGPIFSTTALTQLNVSTIACGGPSSATTVMIGNSGADNTITGGFTTLANALGTGYPTSLGTTGVSAPVVLELQSTYASEVTNTSLVIGNNGCFSATRGLTIRPAAGATGLSISSSVAGPTIDMSGANYVTFDGRPGGTGSTISVPNTNYLTIKNTNTVVNSCAVRMLNEAQNNTFKYCDIQGVNATNTSNTQCGVVLIWTTTGTTGNDNNTIDNCNIHGTDPTGAATAQLPNIGLYSYGTQTTALTYNDNNTVSNCNIYDFFSNANQSTGLKCDAGTNAWTISNNHVFQQVTRAYTTGNTHRGFWITPAGTGNAFVITGNYIGGNASNGTGTYTINSAFTNSFWGMDITVGTGNATSVQNNTITNISLTGTTTTGADFFRGISTGGSGNIDVGTITANTIGAETGIGTISLNSGSGSASYGLKISSTLVNNVSNNKIGAITTAAATATNAMNFLGISVSGGTTNTINNNLVGSLATANSINASNAATSTTQSVTGISVTAGTTTTVSGNTVANLNNNYNTTGLGQTRGIVVSTSTTSTISGNTIRNLTSTSLSTSSGSSAAIIGIAMTTNNPATVTGNTVHTLALTAASTSAAVNVEGIVFGSNGATPTNLVTKNFIHSFNVMADNPGAILKGLDITGGSNIVTNNMIRLGIRPDGTSLTSGCNINGIYLTAATPENFYFNSVYIGGTGVAGANATYAFRRTAISTHDVRNNIFANVRSNSTGTGKHYAIASSAVATTSLTPDYNLYQYSGTGGLFALANATDISVYNGGGAATTNWVSTDVNGPAGSQDPQFLTPNGTSSTVNLHINPTIATAVESAGIAISGITDDYDGDTRSSLTPTDIGADAGAFTVIPACASTTINPGSAVASSVTACTASLSLTGNTTQATGLSYQWQSRAPSGSGSFTNINGATFSTYNANLAAATTDFQCVISCSGGSSVTSTPVTVTAASPGVAAGYSPLDVTGFNADVIANGNTGTTNPPANTTTFPVDATGGYEFYDASYSYNGSTFPATSLPVNGQVVSTNVTGLLYKLQPASNTAISNTTSAGNNNNVLQLRGGGGTGTTLTGTLTLSAPQSGTAVYLLAVSGNGASTINATVNFSDATTQTFTGLTVNDWFNATPYSQGGFGRVNASGFDASAPGGNNPRMYDITLALSASNYNKNVQSITITNTSAATATAFIVNVFAVTMAVPSPTAFCGNLATSVTLFNPPSSGATYQWQSSATSGGTYTNVSGGTGATTTTYTNPSPTGPVYYKALVTCTATGYTSSSSAAYLSITAVPTVSVSPTTANYCSGSTGVTLTASGTAASFAWSPTASLSSSTGSSVIATPSATTTYTVTGITNSCTNTATTTITYVAGPVISSVTATPASICTGQTSQLQANVSIPTSNTYCIPTISNTSLHYVANFALTNGASNIISNLNSGSSGTTNNYKDYGTTKTTGSLAAGTTYSVAANDGAGYGGVAVWVDYNQNGVFDDAELVWSAYTNTGTPPNYTGTFTVPSSALNGTTKLRIRNDYARAYGTSSSPYSCVTGNTDGTSTYGETEDYTITITGATAPSAITYSWTPSAGLSSSTIYNPVATPTAASTTYSVTATANGCTTNPQSVTVVMNDRPTAPTANNSTQCGTMVPSASVTSTSGLGSPVFNWYDDPTAGTLLQSGVTNTRNAAVSATTTFYVTEVGAGGCESTPRTAVTVDVTAADPISISGPSSICIGSPAALSVVQTGSNNSYDFTWSASPLSNSGVGGSTTGANQSYTPTVGGSYTYSVTAVEAGTNCQQLASFTVAVTDLSAQGYTAGATASPATICAGTNTTLTGTFVKPGTVTLGTGTGTNTTTGNLANAYPSYYGNGRQQYLVLASELTALGLKAGNITSLAFKTAGNTGNPSTLNGYTIKIGSTSATSITTFQSPTFTTVWGPTNYTPAINSTNTHGFITPYNWDGTSNLVIDICFSNQVTGSSAYQCYQTSTGFTSAVYYQADGTGGAGACNTTTVTGTGSLRPNMIFAGNLGQSFSSYSWSDGTSVAGTTNPLTVAPTTTTTYTITGTHSTGCTLSAPVTVTTNPIPSVPGVTNSTQCGVGVPTASVSSTSGLSNPIYKWYSAATGGTLLQSGSATTNTTSISATTDFYVTEASASGCESSPRVKVTANVTQPDAVSISSASASCIGSAISFTANKTGSANTYVYTWSANPSAGSGVSGSPTGASQTFTATATGTYAYTVTAFDAGSNCTAVAVDTVRIYQGLSGTVSATQITSCTNPTGLITANVSGAGTVVNNNFASSTLPSYMTIQGSAAITGGQLQITPSSGSQSGGVLIQNTTGLSSSDFQIDFDFITTASGGVGPADGLSYSYGDDVVIFPSGTGDGATTTAAENGSGTKLKLSFDAINNTGGCPSGQSNGNKAGVYLMYNTTNIHQGGETGNICSGVLYYTPDVSWRATSTAGATTHVTIKINAAGQVSMLLNNVVVVNNVQLPASYLTADKTNWKHAFAARTGGGWEGHFIDNLLIQYNNFYEYSINGGTSWTTTNPIIPPTSGTYSVDARYVSVPSCSNNLGSVTINTPVYTTTSTTATYCTYSGTTPTLSVTPAFSGATYQWESSPAGANTWSPVSGATGTTYTPSAAGLVASTDYRVVISCGGTAAIGSPSAPITITVETPVVNTVTDGSRCGPGSVTLQAVVSAGATAKWYSAATGGSSIGSGSPFSTPNISSNTTYYVSAVTSLGCESARTAVNATISPVPSVSNQTGISCSGSAFTITPTGVPAATTYTWSTPTYTGSVTGGSAQGTGQSSLSQTLTNSGATNGTATYTVTPMSGTCPGNSFTATITVNPRLVPSVTTPITSGSNPSCQGGSVTFTASPVNAGASPTYQWYVNGSPAIGETDATFTVTGVTTAYNPTVYVVMTVTPGTCATQSTAQSSSTDLTVQSNSWTGSISDNWNDGRNWCSGTVPASSTDVTIPVLSSARYPVISNVANVRNINIVSGAKVTLGSYLGAGPLTIFGQLSGAGTFSTGTSTTNIPGANGNLIFAGTGALGTLKLTPGSYALNSLSLTGTGATLALGDTVKIVSKVDVGSNTLSAGGFMTIKSDKYGTANVSPVNGGNITGNLTVERYIPANGHAGYRLLSVPTQTTQTFHQAWQENQAPMVVGTQGLGTLITAPQGTAAGFDAATAGPSLQKFNQTTGAQGSFSGVTTTNIGMATTAGYFLYIRGDRTVQPSGGIYPPTSTVLRTNGPLYIGTQTAITLPANTNVLVGNVYASAVDFATMVRSNVNAFKVWDPKLLGTYNLGAYQTFSSSNGYDPVPGGGSYGSTPNSRIESGQAFIVSSSTGGSIQFTEAAKTTGSRNVFRSSGTVKQFKTNLYAETQDGPQLADGNSVVFDDVYSAGKDEGDVIKARNIGEDFAVMSNDLPWVIETRKSIGETDVIQYNMRNLKQQEYTLEFLPKNMAATVTGYLEDKFTSSKTPVSMTDATTVRFTVTADAASKAEDRFRIVFSNKTSPVMTAEVKTKENSGFNIYPNPIVNSRVNVEFKNQAEGKYMINLVDKTGAVKYSTTVSHSASTNAHSLALPSSLAAGTYQIEIVGNEGDRSAYNVIIANK